MVSNDHISRVHDLASEIAEQNMVIRGIIGRAVELLRAAPPDTFLGRKTQEPFPSEHDPIERDDIQNLIHSELKPPE